MSGPSTTAASSKSPWPGPRSIVAGQRRPSLSLLPAPARPSSTPATPNINRTDTDTKTTTHFSHPLPQLPSENPETSLRHFSFSWSLLIIVDKPTFILNSKDLSKYLHNLKSVMFPPPKVQIFTSTHWRNWQLTRHINDAKSILVSAQGPLVLGFWG